MKIAVAIVVAIAIVLAATFGFLFLRDNFATHYPMKVLSAHAFRSGEIPWWNFNDIGGQPLAGNPNALTFYPDAFLFVLLPGHVAFNLHFFLHLVLAFFTMRALCLARGLNRDAALFGASMWVTSGLAISCLCLYNLVPAIALVPLALLGTERKSAQLVGLAFGLMLLAAEPVMLIGTAIAVAFAGAGRMPLRCVALAAAIAVVIGSPQLIAFYEIAGEIERIVPFRQTAVLGASVSPLRVAEIVLWPLKGYFVDRGNPEDRLFSTIYLGLIVAPAIFRRSRYTAAALTLLFFALGEWNPVVQILVAYVPSARIMRYPEKLVVASEALLVVLAAEFFARTRQKKIWIAITFAPLLYVAVRTIPIDWFAPYRVTPQPPVRVQAWNAAADPKLTPREMFHKRAHDLEWMFGAVAGRRYALGRSPDRMHSALTRTAVERFGVVSQDLKRRYLRIAGCNVPGHLPDAMIVPRAIAAADLAESIRDVESPQFDEHQEAVGPAELRGFVSAPGRVVSCREIGQTVRVDLETSGPVLLFVNQSFFDSWVATARGQELDTVPLDIDRLGVVVPAGVTTVELRFGRYRRVVDAAWIASALLTLFLLVPQRVEKRDGGAGEVERSGDENPPRV